MKESTLVRASVAQNGLYARYDELNETWLEAERMLTSFHVPHDFDVVYSSTSSDNDGPAYEEHSHLALIKVKGTWRICHGFSDDVQPEVRVWTPITECSALIRVAAAPHFEKLFEEAVRVSEQFLLRTAKAISHLRKFMTSQQDLADELADKAKLVSER